MFWLSPCSPGMTIKEGTRGKGVAWRDNPKHRSNCLKSLRRNVYRHREVLSTKKAINAEISHEWGCGRSLSPRNVAHASRPLFVREGRHRSIYAQGVRLRRAGSSGCEKLLPCTTFARCSNRPGRVPSKTTHHSAGHPSGVHPNHLGHAAHHLPDRRFIRSVCSAHVLGVPAYASTVTRCQ